MKIAYVYDAVFPYRIGGVEKRIFEISRRLAAKGHEVHVFGLKEWDGKSTFYSNGVCYHGVGLSKSFYINGRRSCGEALYFGLKILNPLKMERFDIIDCQNFPYFSCISSAIASQIKGSPLVITWHEVWGDYWYNYLGGYGFTGKIIEKLTTRLSNNMVAVSNLTKNDLSSIAKNLNITVIPNGVDVQKINSIQGSASLSDILFSGRLTRDKKVDLLIRAVGSMRKEFPDIRVIIAGDGSEKDRLQKLTRQCDLDNNIIFLGFTHDDDKLISLMKSSRIFASPSMREGFGMAAIEALTCGLPVVTINSSKNAVKDLISDKTGIISDANPESFAEALLECLKRRDIMTGHCKNIAENYDWNKIVQEIEQYYGGISGISR
jgi:L-malate glycosyltransferase